jgi:DNA-directed RNA polymerase subunit beta'
MKRIVDFTALQVKLASPETILDWSHGEIKKPETINYRSLKAEKDGLFDERIFGPTKDYECYCGKYKRIRYKGIVCDRCGVEVTQSKVRRERMGHIDLAAPVAHIWYFRGAPSKLSLLLNISARNLNSIIYFSKYVVLSVDKDQKAEVLEQLIRDEEAAKQALKDETKSQIEEIKKQLAEDKQKLQEKVSNKETLELKLNEVELKAKQDITTLKETLTLETDKTTEIYNTIRGMVKKIKKGTILTEDEYLKLDEYDAVRHIRVGMGAESVMELVKGVDLDKEVVKLRQLMDESKGAKRIKAIKRLRVIEGFRKAKINPVWMFLNALPVLPPDLRPMVQLSGGRFATSDLNDLYRRVINRNNRLKHLINLGAPEIILRNEKRMLQEAVDSLIDKSNSNTNRRNNRRQLKSLSEMLKGKQGRFRQNLLGKRVDYSGRSVIVVGPHLKLDECGIPKDIALEMFKPYVLRELINKGISPNVKSAKHLIERHEPEVYNILEDVTKNHPVILNRAPTLHKLGMQAFYPTLTEGNAIQLHPCVCSGYNADFDGDQMAIHVPLTKAAQKEARELMLATNNLLKPANGEPITVPNKDMALGSYYLTSVDNDLEAVETIFASKEEVYHALQSGHIKERQLIKVRLELEGKKQIIETTAGRLQFNDILPDWYGFLNEAVSAKKIKEIVTKSIESQMDHEKVAELIDHIKELGFKTFTKSGLSVAITDCKMIDEKHEIVKKANKEAEKIADHYLQGLITNDEKKRMNVDLWMKTTEEIADKTWITYDENNSVKLMIDSGGTRASKDQVKQLAAMRGLVVDPLGNIVEMPTKSNFREGLTIFEYVTSARGSRKGLTDTALKTADAGYLTRRLVDVSHDVIIRMDDCETDKFIEITRDDRAEVFAKRITGRTAAQDVKSGNKIIVKKGEIINQELAEEIDALGIEKVGIRSPLTCEAPMGMCSKCYGWDFSTRDEVKTGVPVGVIAAQSIGEPGTQLTMRTKHKGGIVGLDVTQGLPRIEELFEARTPKSLAPIAQLAGKVSLERDEKYLTITITSTSGEETESYKVAPDSELLVKDGELVHLGTQLTQGSVDPKEIMAIKGLLPTQQYILSQAQKVYESQGIPIHDKHFEVIIRKMADKVQIENPGDTEFLTGEILERNKFATANDATMAAGGEPATAKVMILGITRSSLFTSSWLSAASFQHTKRVLTDAASSGAVDYLDGLKENVIIGRLIPTSPEKARLDLN